MTAPREESGGIGGFLLRDLPYAAMLLLGVGGLVLTSFRGATWYYWMMLAPIYALIVILSGWRHLETGAERMRLVVTQLLHWLAFLGAMWLMFLPEVRGVVNDNATSLALLILLALGTFVAGVHASSLKLCINGAVMALMVPAIAWLDQSALMLTIIALIVIAAAAIVLWRRAGRD